MKKTLLLLILSVSVLSICSNQPPTNKRKAEQSLDGEPSPKRHKISPHIDSMTSPNGQYSIITEHEIITASENGDYDTVKKLLGSGVSPEWRAINGSTPIMFAAQKNHVDIVKLLIDYKANINAKARYQDKTALMFAAAPGCYEACELLISRGADIDVRDSFRRTSLIYATRNNKVKILELLIKNNANINFKDIYGHTALMYAAFGGLKDSYYFLLSKNADKKDLLSKWSRGKNIVMVCALDKNIKAINFLLSDCGFDIDATDDDGNTALMLTSCSGLKEVVELLLSKKANVNIKNKNGHSALALAATHGYENIYQLLLSNGANKDDVLGKNGVNLLMHNSANGNTVGINFLLKNHLVDITATNDLGRTAILYAIDFNRKQAFDLLLSKESSDYKSKFINYIGESISNQKINAINFLLNNKLVDSNSTYNGIPLVIHSAFTGNQEIFNLLLSYGANKDSLLSKYPSGCTYLMSAISNKNIKFINLILNNFNLFLNSNSTHINTKNELGYTALMYGVCYKMDKQIIELLIKYGADISIKANDNSTAQTMAVANKLNNIVELLENWEEYSTDFNVRSGPLKKKFYLLLNEALNLVVPLYQDLKNIIHSYIVFDFEDCLANSEPKKLTAYYKLGLADGDKSKICDKQ